MAKEIGNVFLVAPDGAHKFKVSCQKNTDASDFVTRRPFRYDFADITKRTNVSLIGFYAEISSWVAQNGDENSISVDTHVDIVRAALRQFQTDTSQRQLLILAEHVKEVSDSHRSGDASLERDLSQMFLAINSVWPDEELHVYDLVLMFNADQQELEAWLGVLHKKGSLLARKQRRLDLLRGENLGDATVYKLNPTKREEILTSFGTSKLSGVRVFLSYSTKDKELAGRIKQELEEVGKDINISVFLAHEDLKVSAQWRERIIAELHDCQVFMPLITKKFKGSDWTNQETGFALAGAKKIVPLMCPKKPFGFLETIQGERVNPDDVSYACNKVMAEIRLAFQGALLNTAVLGT